MVAAVYDGQAAVAATLGLKPDILVIDIILPIFNGSEVMRRLAELKSTAKLIILTSVEDPDCMNDALRIGASAFVLKRRIKSNLPIAIRMVLAGNTFVSATRTPEN